MHTYNGAIQKDIFHIQAIGKVLMYIFLHFIVALTGKALVNAVQAAIFLLKQSPMGSTT